jgi:hypothetical protein
MGLLSGGFATGFIEGFADSVSDAIEKDMDRVNKRVERISELKLKRAIKDQEERDEKIKEVTEALAEAQSLFGKDDPRAPAYAAAMLKESGSISSFKELTNTIKSSDTYKRGESISNFLEFSEQEMPTGTISDFAKAYVGKPKSISDYRLPEDSVTAGAGNLLSAIGIKQDVSGRIESRVGEELAAMGLRPEKDTGIAITIPSGVFQREKFTLSNMTPVERLEYYERQLANPNNTQERRNELRSGLRINNDRIMATGNEHSQLSVLESRLSRAKPEDAAELENQIQNLKIQINLKAARTDVKNPLALLEAQEAAALKKAVDSGDPKDMIKVREIRQKKRSFGPEQSPADLIKEREERLFRDLKEGTIKVDSEEHRAIELEIETSRELLDRVQGKDKAKDITGSDLNSARRILSGRIDIDLANKIPPEDRDTFKKVKAALESFEGNLSNLKTVDPDLYDRYIAFNAKYGDIVKQSIASVLSDPKLKNSKQLKEELELAASIFYSYGEDIKDAQSSAELNIKQNKTGVTTTGDGSEQEPVKTEDVSLNTDFKAAFPDNRPGAIKLINKALEKGTPLSDIALELENNGDYSPEFIKIIKDEAARIEAKPENEIAVNMQQDQNRDIASAMLIVDNFHNTLLAPNFIAQPSKVNRLVREKLNLGDTKEDKEKASRLIELARQRIVERETPDRTKVDRRRYRTGRAVGGLMSRG